MTPIMLRQLWSLIEASQTSVLLNMDDANLVQWLLKQWKAKQPLDRQEADILASYIRVKIPLIRDLAQDRILIYTAD